MIIVGHTLGTPELSVEEALRLFARLGCQGAEVICQAGYRSGIAPTATDRGAALRDLGRALGVPVVALTPYESAFTSLDDTERRQALEGFHRCLDLAGRMEVSFIRLYGGRYVVGEGDYAAKRRRLLEALRELGDHAGEVRVTLAVENHFNTMADTAAHTVELVREADHPCLRILYDQANLDFSGGEGYEEALRLQAGLIAYVHVKDFVFRGSERTFRARAVERVAEDERTVRSVLLGRGVVPWPQILSRLRAQGYDGPLSLEYERRWHPQDLPPPEEGLAASVEVLRGWVEALS